MKAWTGTALEALVLAGAASLAAFIPRGSAFSLYVVVLQLASTYLIHCPAHYLVGRALGIRFASIRMGRSTLAKAVPPRLAGAARLVPILTLTTERASLAASSKGRAAAMFASGTVASAGAALVIALVVTAVEPGLPAAIAWSVALLYLAFDIVFSPRSGDIFRARKALA